MNTQLISLALTAIVSAGLSWLAIKYLRQALIKRQIVDRPNERSMHQGEVPRGGGLVIIFSVILASFVVAISSERYAIFLSFAGFILLWAGLSWWDDLHDLSPKLRFSTQIAIAVLTVMAYGWVNYAQLTASWGLYFGWFGAACTVFGILWLANLFNFMDGLDGLCAAQAIIGSITIGFWFFLAGDYSFAIICTVLAASSYAFFLWNWRPARIFMGDVGSISIGAIFATLLVIGVSRYDIPAVSFVLLFALFIVDASLTLSRRIIRGEKFWLAHRTHYYQRLAGAGVSHTKITIGAIILMSLCSLISTFALLYRDTIGVAILIVISLLLAALICVVRYEKRRQLNS